MDLTEYTKQQGEFLKAEVVIKNPDALFEIVGEAETVENPRFNKMDLNIPLKLGEALYTFNCSKTNARTISATLGVETKEWIGKHLVFETYKTKTSDGKLVEALNVREVKK